ncbi:unnamed protein product [Amaranthus hypochondriacus]
MITSRKEKRKAARLEKKLHKHKHLILRRSKQNVENINNNSSNSIDKDKDEGKDKEFKVLDFENVQNSIDSDVSTINKKKHKVIANKSKFEEYLQLETTPGPSIEEDMEMELRLAKKLKLKKGKKLHDEGDGLNNLFEGIPSFEEFGTLTKSSVNIDEKVRKKKRKRSDKSEKEVGHADGVSQDVQNEKGVMCESFGSGEIGVTDKEVENDDTIAKQSIGKYVAPQLRSCSGDSLQEYLPIRRRIRGLLNRVSESNVESIVGDIFSIFQSVSRAIASEMITKEVLASCIGGPRGNEQYAAVFAAFVAGMSALVGIDFSARLMASLAKSFEDEYLKEDNLSLRNLSLLLSYLCIFGVCSSDLIYDFLSKLSKRLTEVDVSTILTVLQCCGMKLRGDDPVAMKDFIQSVQSRVTEIKAASGDTEATTSSKRMEFMLETICDIKNNKKRVKDDSPPHTRIKKWLQKLRVEDITIRGVKWSKLLDPLKKGQWWFSGDVSSPTKEIRKVSDKEVNEAQKMLQLAAKQKMNTDIRRAIFCVIMSGEDYMDAFEQLLSLNLQGKQDREIMRVLVECCLQEKMFNRYYTALASKLCSHDKNHKFTLQYCLWDQFKELESMPLRRSMHLARFVAEMLASFTLSLATLKVVDLSDATQLTAKRIMHFRMLFEAILEYSDSVVWNIFTRIAITPELEDLRSGLEFFMREYVVAVNNSVAKRYKLAKKALNNAQGVLM